MPYEEIDCEIRHLVKLMNRFPGICTTASCIGHDDHTEAYISFLADSQDHLRLLMLVLPFLRWKGSLMANQFRWQCIWIDTNLDNERRIQYALRIAGAPLFMQRQAIAEAEDTLSKSLATLAAEHPFCPIDASDGNVDTKRCCQ
jgi:hypothetical protein